MINSWSILQSNEDLVKVGLGNENNQTSAGQLRFFLENGVYIITRVK